MRIAAFLIALALAAPVAAAPDTEITPRQLPLPELTAWRPLGCRSVPFSDPILLPRTAFRRSHGDLESTDEVEVAFPPVLAREWIAEPSLYQVTTPAFDGGGNLYMTPLLPHEPILMISLDGATGARRFVLPLEPGQRGGGAAPMVLRDPESDAEVVYVNSYSRLVAVRTDGTIVWDVPTGLGDASTPAQSPIGLAWVPTADAIAATTRDGYVLLHDRSTGTPLTAPLQLPGERTPPRESVIPPALAAQVDELLAPLVAFSSGGTLDLINVLLGGDSEVANNFSVDPRTGRLWIAATAPDGEDGKNDGVSEVGALYRFDLVLASGGGWQIEEACHRSFPGGSASTPTLGQNGTRVYLGDDAGSLIAVDAESCGEAWAVPLDSKIFGSVSAASDGHELYASSADGIFQLFDEGDHGRRGWTAKLDLYDIPADLAGYAGVNLLLVGTGANGLLIQVGVGTRTPDGQSIPVRTGIAHVDRATGEPRSFTDGLEESLGAMSTGPDGSLYLPHAPLRRAFALALGSTTEPLIGGISKWGPTRHDLLARDAACAAAERATNALDFLSECPESARADVDQVGALRDQVRTAVTRAVDEGDLDPATGARVQSLATQVGVTPGDDADTYVRRVLSRAERSLGRVCHLLSAGSRPVVTGACTPPRLATTAGAAAPGSSVRRPADRCRASRRLGLRP